MGDAACSPRDVGSEGEEGWGPGPADQVPAPGAMALIAASSARSGTINCR
ncbi:MAG: hypothetical protein L3K19_06430 [Thermoplasmata archaeon]|nr:hypothetical protein [Thermoplasmata archaeon]